MSTDLKTAEPEDPLSKVVEIFKKHQIHHLPIIADKKLKGLITTSDLMWANKKFDEYDQVPISDVMTTNLATLEADAKIGTAAQIFLKNWFHALPIVDEQDNLIGIITTFDVLRYTFQKEYPNEKWDWL
jgi:CBS domain-containing protein